MVSNFLKPFRYIIRFIFEIKKPEKAVSFKKKLFYTSLILALYLIMLAVPLWGITTEGQDPFFALRAILASQRGSLAELGIGPIVTAGMILQLLVGSRIISVNFQDSEEKMLYTGAQKVIAILMTVFESIAYIAGGAYGEAVQNDVNLQFLIIIQLVMAGIAIMLMDEFIQKGYGLGSGISLFIAASVSFQVVKGFFDFTSVLSQVCGDNNNPDCQYPSGAIWFFFNSIFRNNIWEGLWHPNIVNSPDIFNVLATIVVFGVVIYFESMKIEIPVQHQEHRMPARYPIKFLYVSNIPVILVSALFANIYLLSNLLTSSFANDTGLMGVITRFVGEWEVRDGQNVPIGGIASFTTAPNGINGVANNPWGAIGYLILLTIFSTLFAMVWVETAGMSSKDVARQLIGANMQIPGFRRNQRTITKYLDNYIPYAAFLGGVFIGLLAGLADFVGAIGTGTGILLTTGIIRQYYEILGKERLADIYPQMAGFLGI